MPVWQPPRANEIAHKLREDFGVMLRQYDQTPEETDPILAVLFRSFAAQIENVYKQAADAIPLAMLDELMTGFGMPERSSQPAQTVVQFTLPQDRERLAQGTGLIAQLESREKITFALDTAIDVSAARLNLAAIYQHGLLRLHPGVELTKEFVDARPSLEPVPVELGPNPAIFMAVEIEDEQHLSNHGFYIELTHEATELRKFLQRAVWCLLDHNGEAKGAGLLRPRPGNAGAHMLEWLTTEAPSPVNSNLLREGFYGGQIFIFPEIPTARRFLPNTPMKMEAALNRIFQASGKQLFSRPRAWIRIMLPREADTITEDIVRIALHCTTASNLEILNQTLEYEKKGTSIPFWNGGERPRYLVAPISIKGPRGNDYLHESKPSADQQVGRYRFRGGRIELEPARSARGEADNSANVRLALSNGQLGNNVKAGGITTFASKAVQAELEVTNCTAAAGGSNGENFMQAQRRFSELLLSRERVVTDADLETVIRAFEPKIRGLRYSPMLERGPTGLRRLQRITITLDRTSFNDPDEEGRLLRQELETHLQERALLGLVIRVELEWI